MQCDAARSFRIDGFDGGADRRAGRHGLGALPNEGGIRAVAAREARCSTARRSSSMPDSACSSAARHRDFRRAAIRQVLDAVVTPAVRGDYVVTPDHIRMERGHQFWTRSAVPRKSSRRQPVRRRPFRRLRTRRSRRPTTELIRARLRRSDPGRPAQPAPSRRRASASSKFAQRAEAYERRPRLARGTRGALLTRWRPKSVPTSSSRLSRGCSPLLSPCVLPLLPAYLSLGLGPLAPTSCARVQFATRCCAARDARLSLASSPDSRSSSSCSGSAAVAVGRVVRTVAARAVRRSRSGSARSRACSSCVLGLHLTGRRADPRSYRDTRFSF